MAGLERAQPDGAGLNSAGVTLIEGKLPPVDPNRLGRPGYCGRAISLGYKHYGEGYLVRILSLSAENTATTVSATMGIGRSL